MITSKATLKSVLPTLLASGFFLLLAAPALAGGGPGCVAGSLCNPISVGSIEGLLVAILNIIVIVMIPIVIFFIIYAGFLYVTAQGNSEQVQKASRALLYAVIGGVLIIGAEAITIIIENVVNEFRA